MISSLSSRISALRRPWIAFFCAIAGLTLACSTTPVYVMLSTALPTAVPTAVPTAGPGVQTLAAVIKTATAFLPASPTASFTVTFTPTPSPSATPQPTETLTPTITPTPSDTPTETVTPTPEPTLTPIFLDPNLPSEASISGIAGYDQAMPLSCEARSAVDWAGYFGVYLDELDFQNRMDYSDNPNTGFVGDPNGETGRIPPESYGVHAPPVAKLLREYGLNAQSRTGLTPDDLRFEVSQGRPVIAWVVGHVWSGYGRWYTASDGETMIVAPYEHTVIVTAYSLQTITVLDGSQVYSTTWEQFLSSWAVLGNMGIVFVN